MSPSTSVRNTGTGCVAGSVNGSPVVRLNVLECLGHSISRSSHQTSPSASETLAWVHVSPMAYTSSSMRTRATGTPPTTMRRAVPGAMSARATVADAVSVAISGRPGQRAVEVELGRHLAAQLLGERAHRQLVEDLVEEAEDDEPLGDLRPDAPALEVEALLGVDRADRRRMAATDVVRLDLQVRHALGPRALAEGQVAVGLERDRAPGVLADLDQARVDAARLVLHRAL